MPPPAPILDRMVGRVLKVVTGDDDGRNRSALEDRRYVRRRGLLGVGALATAATSVSVLAGVGIGRQMPKEAGATHVGRGELVINVRDHGAVGDGVADDTDSVQEAINTGGITYFPPGTYMVSNLSAAAGMHLVGAGTVGQGRSRLRAGAGNVFRTTGSGVYGTKCSSLVFDSSGGGGDLFTGMWSLGVFEDCSFIQYQTHASCFNVTGWIDMLTIRCTFDHTHSATAPTFKAVSGTGELAQSSFLSSRFTRTGDYAIHLEGTMGSVVANFTIRDTNFEEPRGGAIRLLSARNTSIQNPGMWDFHAGGATKHLIFIGTSPTSGAVSSNNEVSHYIRDGSLGPGPDVYDIKLGTGTVFTSVLHSRHQLDGVVLLDMANTTGLVVSDNAAISNGMMATVISGKSVKFPQVTADHRPAPVMAGAGAQTYDSTVGALIYSDGSNWRKVSDDSVV